MGVLYTWVTFIGRAVVILWNVQCTVQTYHIRTVMMADRVKLR